MTDPLDEIAEMVQSMTALCPGGPSKFQSPPESQRAMPMVTYSSGLRAIVVRPKPNGQRTAAVHTPSSNNEWRERPRLD